MILIMVPSNATVLSRFNARLVAAGIARVEVVEGGYSGKRATGLILDDIAARMNYAPTASKERKSKGERKRSPWRLP